MDPYFRPTALDLLPSNIIRVIVCGEYGWQNVYHYFLHSCYAQPDASYWIQAVFELWRNTIMLIILTTIVLSIFVGLTLAVNAVVWLIAQGVKNATTMHEVCPAPRTPLKNKSQKVVA
jgi:hypothetical protein